VKGISIFNSTASTILLNTLTVVTFTKQGTAWAIFKNDQQVASITSLINITVTNNKMYLGYNFRGIFDKVAIYPSFLKDCPPPFCISEALAPYNSIQPRIFTFFLSFCLSLGFFFFLKPNISIYSIIHFSSNCLWWMFKWRNLW